MTSSCELVHYDRSTNASLSATLGVTSDPSRRAQNEVQAIGIDVLREALTADGAEDEANRRAYRRVRGITSFPDMVEMVDKNGA